MARKRTIPADHPAFAGLPVHMLTLGKGDQQVAVHLRGAPSRRRPTLLAIAGYHRNMADLGALADGLGGVLGHDWPIALVDLRGRGRSSDRARAEDYSSLADAADIAEVVAGLSLGPCVMLGQGHGGQVIMALSSAYPNILAGAILVDAGPVTDTRGLVRLRNNLRHIEGLRGESQLERIFSQILAADYPDLNEVEIGNLMLRAHFLDKRERARALFDAKLLERLDSFEHDDILVAQWPLFNALASLPLMLLRTQFSDQLRRETFEEMVRRRPDAVALTITGQGAPALLDQNEETTAIAEFIRHVALLRGKAAA